MLVFAGHSGGNGDQKDYKGTLLDDLWRMQPGQLMDHQVTGTAGQVIHDAKNLYVSVDTGGAIDADRCIVDIDVEITITHACTRDLRIQILGPGPVFTGVRAREGARRTHR